MRAPGSVSALFRRSPAAKPFSPRGDVRRKRSRVQSAGLAPSKPVTGEPVTRGLNAARQPATSKVGSSVVQRPHARLAQPCCTQSFSALSWRWPPSVRRLSSRTGCIARRSWQTRPKGGGASGIRAFPHAESMRRHARPCAGHPRLCSAFAAKDVDGRDPASPLRATPRHASPAMTSGKAELLGSARCAPASSKSPLEQPIRRLSLTHAIDRRHPLVEIDLAEGQPVIGSARIAA